MTDEAHLDDDALSAVLDGEARPEDDAHVDACARCRDRLQVLRDASLLVRTPVPAVADAERDAAIAAALAATTAEIVPLRPRRAAPRWRAAAALVALVAIGALLVRGGGGGDDDSSGGQTALSTTVVPGASGGATASGAAAGPVDGGDLGAIDARQLQSTIEAALGGRQQNRAAADSAAPEAAAGSKTPDCETTVRAGNPDLGALVYRASGTFDGAPVAVLAFDAAGRRWVYVVGVGDCAIRNQTTYSV